MSAGWSGVYWLVMTDFGPAGIGAPDPAATWDDALDQLAVAADEDRPARVFRLDLDASAITEVTAEAQLGLQDRVAGRAA
ncbi:hypothetical protein DSD19_04695 [Rhodovulum sp. BSW8]|uniref:hypothetical protein n=1 Tax=Rhodovulum sp. BSW8 TaxID=2259645 RepID=UPI000DE3A0E7|nr:hypothetical protein [Rhodovulum sp. BSW8]RBO54678.1 hypothetical protein DSD19_04695 [Rhodovulum sp. BSW8]